MSTRIYRVDGMTCGGCARSLRSALARAGLVVEESDISVADGTLALPSDSEEHLVKAAIEAAGFTSLGPVVSN